MFWKCPQCGLENSEALDACAGMCGHLRHTRLVLRLLSNGREIRLNLDSEVGRRALKSAGDPDAKFASQPQFSLIRDKTEARWLILHHPSATNPTFVNGLPLPGSATQLREVDVISVGADRMKLEVRFEREA
jgi:hypothetical protein